MTIPLTWQYLLAFWCLGALIGISHERAHHVAGVVICGEWGVKTFNSVALAEGCRAAHPQTYWLATLAGPVLFNYLPLWLAWRTIHNRLKPLVYLLFLVGVPVLVFYIVGVVLEELIITRHVLSDTVWGMPYMVLLAEVLATIGYVKLKSHLWRSAREQTSESVRRDGRASPA
jgi:hypothetical protein